MSTRGDLLREAVSIIDGDRNAQYGNPSQDFARTATYWNVHIAGVFHRRLNEAKNNDTFIELTELLTPADVAIMMSLLKISRMSWSPDKKDHWLDLAGYAGCGYECIEEDAQGHVALPIEGVDE